MIFARTDRCPCGALLAYDDTCVQEPFVIPSYWDCSAILLGTADTKTQHTDLLPFAFYEIKSATETPAEVVDALAEHEKRAAAKG